MNELTKYALTKATLNDTLALRQANLECWRAAYRSIFAPEILDELEKIITVEGYQNMLAKPHDVYLLRSGSTIIGFASFGKPRLSNYGMSNLIEIYSIYVMEDFWGLGVGKYLINFLEQEIIHLYQPESIIVWTLEQNFRAQQFYRKNNYQLTTEHKEFCVGGHKYPEVMFQKMLCGGSVR